MRRPLPILLATPLLATVAVACADPRPAAPPPVEATEAPEVATPRRVVREDARARIVAVGDIMMHGMVKKTAADHASADNHDGFDVLWDDVAALVKEADLAFGNLETPIAPDHDKGTRQMVFNAPLMVLDSLAHAGFDVVSFANNHVYDQGRDGFLETVERLEAHELGFIGAGKTCAAARKARLLDAGGITIGWIGSTDLYNHDLNTTDDAPCTATFEPGWVVEEAAAAREAGAELVIASVHWGVEYAVEPLAEHRAAATAVIDGGVDVVLGHHPHVLQPLEVHTAPDGRRGLIAYSLGNFVSNQSAWYVHPMHSANAGNPRDGLLLGFDVVRKDYGVGGDGEPVMRTELAAVTATPLFTLNNTHHRRGDAKVDIHVEPTATRWATVCAALPDAGPDDQVALLREADTLATRWQQVRSVLTEAFVAPAPPTATCGGQSRGQK